MQSMKQTRSINSYSNTGYAGTYINKPLVSFINNTEAESYLQQIHRRQGPIFGINYFIAHSTINVTDIENKILIHNFYEHSYDGPRSRLVSATEYKEDIPQIMEHYPQLTIGHLVIDKFQLMALKGLT